MSAAALDVVYASMFEPVHCSEFPSKGKWLVLGTLDRSPASSVGGGGPHGLAATLTFG